MIESDSNSAKTICEDARGFNQTIDFLGCVYNILGDSTYSTEIKTKDVTINFYAKCSKTAVIDCDNGVRYKVNAYTDKCEQNN